MKQNSTFSFTELYDKYCGMLYSMALEISSSKKQAEEILIETFKKAHQQKLATQTYPSLLITLIEIIIQTAQEYNGEQENNFKLKQFKNTPLLHKLLCKQINADKYCHENNLTRTALGKIIREEFCSLAGSYSLRKQVK